MKKLKHAVNQHITIYVKKSLFTAMIIMILIDRFAVTVHIYFREEEIHFNIIKITIGQKCTKYNFIDSHEIQKKGLVPPLSFKYSTMTV